MSQESSSTQLCEVLIDCYQDKEKKNHDQTGHDTRSKKTDCNESDEDPLQKHLNAPFTLLRRPASNTNEISFQFGKAKKANFDFTGRGKELRGTRCGGSADEIGGRFRGMRDAESIGEFIFDSLMVNSVSYSLICISRKSFCNSSPTDRKGRAFAIYNSIREGLEKSVEIFCCRT